MDARTIQQLLYSTALTCVSLLNYSSTNQFYS